jgi:NADPH-dependent glutamate synthase beta subunit-like oxidoreductase
LPVSVRGTVIHPQFWPQGLDYTGKKIVVIGSGATAATIVPALCDAGAKVTMLQRSPTWFYCAPNVSELADRLRLIGIDEETCEARPEPADHRLKILSTDIAQAHPNHLGRRPVEHEPVEEIRVTSENHPLPIASMSPELQIGGLVAQVGGVRATDGKMVGE